MTITYQGDCTWFGSQVICKTYWFGGVLDGYQEGSLEVSVTLKTGARLGTVPGSILSVFIQDEEQGIRREAVYEGAPACDGHNVTFSISGDLTSFGTVANCIGVQLPGSIAAVPFGSVSIAESLFKFRDYYALTVSGIDGGFWHWRVLNPCFGQPCNTFGATITFSSGLDGTYVLDRLASGGWSTGLTAPGGPATAMFTKVSGTIQQWTAWMPIGQGVVGPVTTQPCDTPLGTQYCDLPSWEEAGVPPPPCIGPLVDYGPAMFAYYSAAVGIIINCNNKTYQWGGTFYFQDLGSFEAMERSPGGAGQMIWYTFRSDPLPLPAKGSTIPPPGKMVVVEAISGIEAGAGEPGYQYQTCHLPSAEFSLS